MNPTDSIPRYDADSGEHWGLSSLLHGNEIQDCWKTFSTVRQNVVQD